MSYSRNGSLAPTIQPEYRIFNCLIPSLPSTTQSPGPLSAQPVPVLLFLAAPSSSPAPHHLHSLCRSQSLSHLPGSSDMTQTTHVLHTSTPISLLTPSSPPVPLRRCYLTTYPTQTVPSPTCTLTSASAAKMMAHSNCAAIGLLPSVGEHA
ncbi:hypothetical protein H4582DRAFT_132436 [Lactarius indigo]|nr:hypothetical protein H4582DRAFT_132436 [Lactarius indigo]